MRVLVVDDHPLVREGLRRILQRAGMEVFAEASSAEEGLLLAKRVHPDLMLWDLLLPDGGLERLGEAKRAAPNARLLVLTAIDDPVLAAKVLEGGADGFLPKTASPEEVLAALQACLRGKRPCPEPALSPRELEILALLREGLGNKAIAARLAISVKTVETHLAHLKKKLGCKSAAELRAKAMRY